MEIATSLAALGLTDIETSVLIHLVKNGQSTAPEVIRSLGIDKSSFYKAVKGLADYGLVDVEGARRMQVYRAASMQKILAYQKSREDQVKEAGLALKKLAEEAEKFEAGRFRNANVQIFEGPNAYFDLMEETLGGEVKLIRDLDPGRQVNSIFASSQAKYNEFMADYIPRRVKKGVWIKVLVDASAPKDEYDRSSAQDMKEAREYPKLLKLGCSMSTFGDRTGFLTVRNKTPWALIVRDPIISNMFKVLFDLMWEQSTPR